MKQAATIPLAGAALAATLSLVTAGSFKREFVAKAAQLAARKTIERDYAPDTVYASSYTGVADIIHVPQREERASVNDDVEPELTGSDYQRPAQRLPRRTAPRWSFQSDTPSPSLPPPAAPRTVLSAPPPLADGPSPIRPPPRLGSKIDQTDKFDAPDHRAASPAENIPPAEPPPGG
ncbi:MAG TPA: hypothetical protein VFC45_14355 [Pseudolabrys sp.]|nr:hypothetical protein [Pseudolabrys sp.]